MSKPKPKRLFTLIQSGLDRTLARDNPWWKGERVHGVAAARRWAFRPVLDNLRSGLTKATVVCGPRQVGKSTLVNQLVNALLLDGVDPNCIFRIQFDESPQLKTLAEPLLELAYWFEEHVLGKSFNQAAHDGQIVYLFWDEVQNFPDWAPQLKHLVDMHPVRVMLTCSSSVAAVDQASLAGRITTLELGPLFLREIAEIRSFSQINPYLPYNGSSLLKDKKFWLGLRQFGKSNRELRNDAFSAFAERGAYPIAHTGAEQPWEAVADLLTTMVIKRAIQSDLSVTPRGKNRDEQLLGEAFRLACLNVGQWPCEEVELEELQRTYNSAIKWPRVMDALRVLDGSMLIQIITPLELRRKENKGPSKICLADHALRAAWLKEIVPLTTARVNASPNLAGLAERIAESAAGSFLKSIANLGIAHFPARRAEPEISFVLTIGEQRIPIEIRYRRKIDYADTKGLRSFLEKPHYNAPFGILATLTDEEATEDPRIVSMPLSTLLMMR